MDSKSEHSEKLDRQSVNNSIPIPSRTQPASELSKSRVRRWLESHAEEDLVAATRFAESAANEHASDDQEHAAAVLRLGTLQYIAYRDSGLAPMLSDAIASFQNGMKLLSASSSGRVEYEKTYMEALKSRLAISVSLEDLSEGIRTAQFIVSHSPKYHMNGTVWYDLLVFYTKRLESANGRRESDVDMAIAAGRACLDDDNMPADVQRSCHFNLCNLYFRRFRANSKDSDINSAIEHGNSILRDIPQQDPNLARWYLALSQALAARFSAKGASRDLADAIHAARQAVSHFEEGCTKGIDKSTVLINLSNRLEDNYTDRGDTAELKTAVGLARDAVKLAQGAKNLQVFRQNLVSLLNSSYNALGNQSDLDDAILIGYGVINETKPDDRDRPAFLTALASSLARRYAAQHALADVREAVRLMREAIALTEPSHISHTVMKSNLSKHLKQLYARTKDPDVIKEVIALQEQCYASSSSDDRDWPMYLDDLANTYDDWFLENRDANYSDKALELGSSAIAARGTSDPARGSSFTNQSARYWSIYRTLHDMDALDRAVENAGLGVQSYDVNHPNRALACNNMGNLLNERYNVLGCVQDRVKSRNTYLEAFHQENAPTTIRIEAGRAAGTLYGEDKNWTESWKVLEQSVRMFPRLSPRSVSRGDQQDSLSHLSGISCLACSAAILAGQKPETCLEILETGRGIISGLSMYSDEDVNQLERQHPIIYEEFDNLRMQMATESRTKTPTAEESRVRIVHFDRLLERIRNLDGFRSFLLAPNIDEILSLSRHGTMICLNATELGSHAIVITATGIRIYPLESLSYERLEEEAAAILGVSKVNIETYKTINERLRGLAEWLWTVAIHPTLDLLGLLNPKPINRRLPRVYWMPCGLLSQMPIHAAGIYKPRSKELVENYVVSSYVTTLKSTVRNRNAASRQSSSPWSQPLIVAMPQTPGMQPLLAEEEDTAVKAIIDEYNASTTSDGNSRVKVLTQKPKAVVKSALAACTLAHFACHGMSSPTDPSQSALFLSSTDALDAEALTMSELAELGMPPGRAKLAFLSACSTAENASGRLLDEVIHLASGFQLMGFNHVVATLWPANNQAAVMIAKSFYANLLQGRLTSDYGDDEEISTAYALHDAVKEVRRKGVTGEVKPMWPPSDVLAWASFVHFGL